MAIRRKLFSFSNILFLSFVSVVVFYGWRYHNKGSLFDETPACGKFESSVNEILSELGIEDRNILRFIHREKSGNFPFPTLWVETEREIHLSNLDKIPEFIERVGTVSKPYKIDLILNKPQPDRIDLEFGNKQKIFQRFIFIKSGKMSGKKRKKIAIVIDDIAGRKSDIKALEDFLALKIPITYAVLPDSPYTRILSDRIRHFGDDVIIHQPMEPEDITHHDPGKDALLIRMSEKEMAEFLRASFKNIPDSLGISNHMGSLFTLNPNAMGHFFNALQRVRRESDRNNFFFLDSKTSIQNVSKKEAHRRHIPFLQNDLFLDETDDLNKMIEQIRLLKKIADKKGTAIAIGHIQRKYMAEALKQTIPELHNDGIEFVHCSELIKNEPVRH